MHGRPLKMVKETPQPPHLYRQLNLCLSASVTVSMKNYFSQYFFEMLKFSALKND